MRSKVMAKLLDEANKVKLIDSIVQSDSQCMTHGELIKFYEEKRAEELWDYHEDELKERVDEVTNESN